MANYIENIDKGFFIEESGIFLPWSARKDEILSLDLDFAGVNNNYYTLNIFCHELPFVKKLGLHFRDSTFKILELICTNEALTLIESYNNHQYILEEVFNEPVRHNQFLNSIFNMNKDDIINKWNFKYVVLTHKLWDRFGIEERLEFFIKE